MENSPKLPEEQENFEPQKAEILAFIDRLDFLHEVEKWHWRNDARARIDAGENFEILKLDYEFYNTTAQIRNEICKKAPAGKGGELCTLIDSELLYKPSSGKNRHEKKSDLLRLKNIVEEFLKNKTQLRFLARKNFELGGLEGKIVRILSEKIQGNFEKYYETIFTADFWMRTRSMIPSDFPNFTTAFEFSTPDDFLQKFTMEKLRKFPEKLKKSLVLDAEEILSAECFSEKDRKMYLPSIRRFSAENQEKLLAQLLFLRQLRDTKMPQFEREQILEKSKRDQKIEKNEVQEKSKLERGAVEKKIKEKKSQEKPKPEKSREKKLDVGSEKQKRIEFLDKCIEHARKVDEEDVMPKEDPKVWSIEGVRNRRHWLHDTNKWSEYVALNRSDKNIPKNADPTGFRHRWLNVETGSNLTGAKAEQGLKYLQRYKDSGYKIAALAGAFSLNWRGASSPTYSPQRFIDKIQEERSKILGTSAVAQTVKK
ncbi:hypothetical protein HN954_03480 [bacterium]|jgi:hypothetical protein|nr:hypothetical protein [bacterium]MBT6832239.1 hypothetical protein [bacterium]MBT6996464.1 hypothetical protein [bacterium]MBT7772289.1 hypothetical protein [bacterium]